MRLLKPRMVDVSPKVVEKLPREECDLERNKYARMIPVGKTD